MVIPLLLAGLTPAAAPATWSYDGHRIVCEIAWRELTPTVKDRVRALLARDTLYDRLSEACVWADEVRREEKYRRFGTAHYVNLEPGAAGVDVERHCGRAYCVIQAIQDLGATLGDTTRSEDERLEALKFLAHFVGDLHQPLHAGYGHDRGGNAVALTFFGDSLNLHRIWDGELLERLDITPDDAGALHADIRPVDRVLWADADPVTWANESFAIVEHEAYRGIARGAVGADYVAAHAYTVERRLRQAGIRLGALLNRILGS